MATIVVLPDSFKMPSRCGECWFRDWDSPGPVCKAMDLKRLDCTAHKPNWCPLRNVRQGLLSEQGGGTVELYRVVAR